MSIVINTNTNTNKLIIELNKASNAYNKAVEKLSTGYKINSSADNPSNYLIASGMDKQISGSLIATSNIDSGKSLLQTAEGVLDVIQDNLLRVRDLTLEVLNGSYSEKEITALETEAKARVVEIDRIANNTEFNDFKVFDTNKTSSDYILFQVGTESDEATNTIKVDKVFYGATLSCLCTDLNSATFAYTGKTREELQTLLVNIDVAINCAAERATVAGASINRLDSARDAMTVMQENITSARSNIMDTDVAVASSEYTKQYIRQQTITSLLAQANQIPSLAMSLI